MPLFKSDRLNWPTNGDINAWADFAETICMFSEGDSLSLEDLADFLKDDASKTIGEILRAINFNEHFLSAPQPAGMAAPPLPVMPGADEDEGQNDDDENGDDFDGDDPENLEREQIRSRLLLLFQFLAARQSYFGAFYPFLAGPGNNFSLRPALTSLQRIYLVLLMSSEMHLYTPGDINRLGHKFEALCRHPFAYLVPVHAEKRFFGAGGADIIVADYAGNLQQRLTSLANDIAVNTTSLIDDPDELGPGGDGGLDWVGWVDFDDHTDHQPLYFGQCACGANWVDKQHETSLSVWRNFLEINQSVQCFHFMPRSFRRTSLDWLRRSQIIQELTLIDRFRLLKIFENSAPAITAEVLASYDEMLQEAALFEYDRD